MFRNSSRDVSEFTFMASAARPPEQANFICARDAEEIIRITAPIVNADDAAP